jgi:hypothetical protein
MDARGATDYGSVSKPINGPRQALAAIDRELKRSRFVALEYGPIGVIDTNRYFASDKEMARARRVALRELDTIFGELRKRDDAKETLTILLSPQASIATPSANRSRTPVIMAAPGLRGLLTSESTRWQGLLTNADIAPTILSWMGVPIPELMPGRPVSAGAHSDPLGVLRNMETQVLANYSARSILVSPYVTLTTALMLAAGILLLFLRGNRRLSYLQPILLAFLLMPAVILVANIPPLRIPWLTPVLVPAASLITGWAVWSVWRTKAEWAAALPALVSVPVILAQLPFDSLLERDSVLGMSSIVGARFYGIGNEYAGILLGAAVIALTAILAATSLNDDSRSWCAAGFFMGLTAIVGLPALGANVGGALATVTTGCVIFLTLRSIKLKFKHVIFIVGGMGLAAAGILAADYFAGSFSHAFRAASLAGNGNLAQIGLIALRKLETNIRLIARTSWTDILVSAVVTSLMLKYGARDLWTRVSAENRTLVAGWKTLGFASIAALLFNDSGVVTAAFMIVFAVFSWLYLMIDAAEKADPQTPARVRRKTGELLSR